LFECQEFVLECSKGSPSSTHLEFKPVAANLIKIFPTESHEMSGSSEEDVEEEDLLPLPKGEAEILEP
jgi:hypothetical protein